MNISLNGNSARGEVNNVIDYSYELELLRDGDRSAELFQSIYNKSKQRLEVIKELHQRFNIKRVPILDRCTTDPMAINNTINNDFFGEIVGTKVGYFTGNPMVFEFGDKYNKAYERFKRFSKKTRIEDLAAETTKQASIGGYAPRLVYIDKNGEEAMINLNPWEVICIGENGIDEPEYGFRFFTMNELNGNQIQRVELYEANRTTYYEGADIGSVIEIDSIDTPFKKCNLFCFENNAELIGDAENVLHLIDAYDRALSDYSSELEAFRSAYLALIGVNPPSSSQEEAELTSSGVFYLKDNEYAKQDAKFITKQMQVDAFERFLKITLDNIYQLSRTPNIRDEALGSAPSGVALKFRLYPLENKTATFERKFVSANMRMLELLSDSYAIRGDYFDPYEIEQHFTRNVPVDLEYEVQALATGRGTIPDEVLYSQISFIKNPKEVAEEMAKIEDAYGGVMNGSDPTVLRRTVQVREQAGTATDTTSDTEQ